MMQSNAQNFSLKLLGMVSAIAVVACQFPHCPLPHCVPSSGGCQLAIQENGCFYEGCPCGVTPPSIASCVGISIGQTGCPKNCGPEAEDWVTAVNGCKSCICKSDVGSEKPGSCPPNTNVANQDTFIDDFTSNTPARIFLLGELCDGDFDCRGIQKCCSLSIDLRTHCVDPEPECPARYNYLHRSKRCKTSADCDQGDACCGSHQKRCVKGVLPLFPQIRYGARVIPSPVQWA